MTLKPTWDDVIAWWKEEKVKREAADARAIAAEALAGEPLRAVQMAYDHQTMSLSKWWEKYGERGASEDYVLRAKTYKSILDREASQRILSRGAGLEAGE